MRILATAAIAVLPLLASGCAWVKLDPVAQAVRVARVGEDLSHCQRAGEIAVSVRDRVGFYERDDLKVRDELETLARNESASLQADTLQALGPPAAGEQRFAGYRCGSSRGVAVAAPPAATTPAQTAPVQPAVTEPLAPAPPRGTQGFEPIEDEGG